jgi:gamma-glutamyltranspeptidase
VDHGMTLPEALAARRWFIADNELHIETSGLPVSTLEGLRGYGYTLTPYPEMDGYFARVHAVLVDPATGTLFGASDPRDYGGAGGR